MLRRFLSCYLSLFILAAIACARDISEPPRSLCFDLKEYVNLAEDDFVNLRMRKYKGGDGQAYGVGFGIPGFTNCTAWKYRTRWIEPRTSCRAITQDFDGLKHTIEACLGTNWSLRDASDYILEGPRGITVRLTDESGIELWVESRSRIKGSGRTK